MNMNEEQQKDWQTVKKVMFIFVYMSSAKYVCRSSLSLSRCLIYHEIIKFCNSMADSWIGVAYGTSSAYRPTIES